ncbi:MAG: hypothetical protein CM1200mP18_23480 [Gammaproteobacteria bacterium]|nr:MAG: hypothetical protein CM1200mP18_23480 [Gammaproteobacteria bacterium]
MHIHAFSPLEIQQGAATLGISVRSFLEKLKESGLSTLPGTAAEILDDEVRQIICPDKLTTNEWLEIIETAHQRENSQNYSDDYVWPCRSTLSLGKASLPGTRSSDQNQGVLLSLYRYRLFTRRPVVPS